MSSAPSDIVIQRRLAATGIPAPVSLRKWAGAALAGTRRRGELTIRIVGTEEGRALNLAYRGKNYATNVLSFPYDAEHPGERMLGDLVICAPVVAREAVEQGKRPHAHWAHMVVHGALHLLGHDHMQDAEAERMESLERKILKKLGFPDPY